MIHWSWQPLLLEELLFSYTLQLKCKQKIDQKCEKKEILIFTSISRVSSVTITNAKNIISFQFSFHNSEENVKNMQYCWPFQSYYYRFSFKKSCFNFNFVNKVEMYILPFEIFFTDFFLFKGLCHIYTNESFNLPPKWIFRCFFCIEQKVTVTGTTFSNS